MQIVVSLIHVFACIVLVLVILLQAGRGGGLSDMFGGGGQQQQKLFGTQTNTMMTKLTTGCAVLFIITSISLGIMTAQSSRSLVRPDALKPVFPKETTTNIEPGNQADTILNEESATTSEGAPAEAPASPLSS